MDTKTPLDVDIHSLGVNLNRNLSKLMEDNGISLSVLFRNTGITIPTIKRLQSDPTANPTITTLLPLANFFGISITELIGKEPINDFVTGYIENKANWLKVPLIEWTQTLGWRKAEIPNDINTFILVDTDVGTNPYALRVEEDDWQGISKNSILIINSDLEPEHKDYAVVLKSGQSNSTLKQIMIEEGKIFLKSLNPYFPPSLFDESYHFLGVLIQIRKDIKV